VCVCVCVCVCMYVCMYVCTYVSQNYLNIGIAIMHCFQCSKKIVALFRVYVGR
jgi:hypothetical protein